MPATPHKTRFAYLDGIRGWAALLVVLHHGTIALDFALFTGHPTDARGAWEQPLSGAPFLLFAAGGNLAVCGFFALSGFVLAHAYTRSRQYWLSLAVRRYVRLGIPMLAGCLLAWMLLALGWMRNGPAALLTHSSWLQGQYQQHPSLVNAVLEPMSLLLGSTSSLQISYDSSLWTMPIEAEASVLLLTVFILLRHAGKHAAKLGGYLFCIAGVIGIGSLFSLFAFGAALRLLEPIQLQAWFGHKQWRLIATLILGLFLGTVPYSERRWSIFNHLAALAHPIVRHTPLWPHAPESFWHGIGAALILLAISSNPAMQSALSGPVSRFLGRISFPLYILHVPVLMVVECNAILLSRQGGLPPLAGDLASLVVFCAAAIGTAAMLTPLIEGGAITLSSWAGATIDTLIRRAVTCLKTSRAVASPGSQPQPLNPLRPASRPRTARGSP